MIIDLFGGPGGWDEAAKELGLEGVIGIEHDLAACQTRAAAGHLTIRADVSTFPLEQFGPVEGLIASPPCTDWSQSGKRAGLDGETGKLVLEVDRWVRALRPRWIACEQVPPAIEWWQRFARDFQELGYSTWAGILNAANYGVPQTRQRAFLLCSLDRRVVPPHPTHDRSPMPGLFGDDLLPWVSMAEALGWYPAPDAIADGDEPAPTVCGHREPRWMKPETRPERVGFARRADERGAATEDGYRERDFRDVDDPAFTVTARSEYWVVQTGNNSHVTSREGSKAGEGGVELYERPITEPAPTVDTKAGGAWRVVGVNTGRDWKAGGTRDDAQVVLPEEPAPTVDGTGRWHALVERVEHRRGGERIHEGIDPNAEPSMTVTSRTDRWQGRPATTVQGDARLWPPGHKINQDDIDRLGEDRARAKYGDRAGTEAIRLGIDDALILQSFRPDYPVQGNKTKQFEQVGNAVPPRLAAHALRSVVSP